MSKLISILEKVQKTFDEICPRWGALLRNNPDLEDAGKTHEKFYPMRMSCIPNDISSFDRCIVGEAHGNTDEYRNNCNECNIFANHYMQLFTVGGRDAFVSHFNECHL